MFKNYYFSMIAVLVVIPTSFILNYNLGLVVAFILLIIYLVEKSNENKKMAELEQESLKYINKIINDISSLNYNIIEYLSRSAIDTAEIADVLKDNNSLLEGIFEKMRTLLDNGHKITNITEKSCFLFVKSSHYSYISHFWLIVECLNLYEFYEKYEKVDDKIDINQYYNDWISLYGNYRLEY